MAASRARNEAPSTVSNSHANDVVHPRTQIHRERLGEKLRIPLPAAHDLRRQRRRGPRIHDVGIADEAAGLPALVVAIPGRRVGRRIDRQPRLARRDGVRIVDVSGGVERIPHRKRDTEEPLPATHQSPFKPLAQFYSRPMRRMPFHSRPRSAAPAELDRLDEPLAARDDLERSIAFS